MAYKRKKEKNQMLVLVGDGYYVQKLTLDNTGKPPFKGYSLNIEVSTKRTKISADKEIFDYALNLIGLKNEWKLIEE